ncbi:MAG: DNA-binding CsgD family transcriptional regulator [Paraglaciecola sp.]|jgi:DNA-binding CsgD family transcriptional regulator
MKGNNRNFDYYKQNPVTFQQQNPMNGQSKTKEELHGEINTLRHENQSLIAELDFHKKIFRDVHQVLEVANDLEEAKEENSAVGQLLTENMQLKSQLKMLRLSNREKEIMQLIVKGFTSKEIASMLKISKLTVDTHRKHIQQKLQVNNGMELIKLAMSSGLA